MVGVMEITGIYGDQLVKLLKLSQPMQDALSDIRFMSAPSTVKALVKRGLMTDAPGSYGSLTRAGEHVSAHLKWEQSCYTCMRDAGLSSAQIQWASDRNISAVEAIEGREEIEASIRRANERRAKTYGTEVMPATPDEVAALVEYINERIVTNELPGDVERAWDAENTALEGASIAAELEAERLAQEDEDRAAFDAETAAQDELIRQGAEMDRRAESGDVVPDVVTEPQPVQVLMDGLTFTLSLASDPHSVVCVGTVLVDRHGEEFTVTGAYLSLGGTRVLRGTYADGGLGVAPYMRVPGLMFRTWPDAPRRIAQDRENAPEAARVTMASPWKTSGKGKRKSSRRNGRTRARQVARTRR